MMTQQHSDHVSAYSESIDLAPDLQKKSKQWFQNTYAHLRKHNIEFDSVFHSKLTEQVKTIDNTLSEIGKHYHASDLQDYGHKSKAAILETVDDLSRSLQTFTNSGVNSPTLNDPNFQNTLAACLKQDRSKIEQDLNLSLTNLHDKAQKEHRRLESLVALRAQSKAIQQTIETTQTQSMPTKLSLKTTNPATESASLKNITFETLLRGTQDQTFTTPSGHTLQVISQPNRQYNFNIQYEKRYAWTQALYYGSEAKKDARFLARMLKLSGATSATIQLQGSPKEFLEKLAREAYEALILEGFSPNQISFELQSPDPDHPGKQLKSTPSAQTIFEHYTQTYERIQAQMHDLPQRKTMSSTSKNEYQTTLEKFKHTLEQTAKKQAAEQAENANKNPVANGGGGADTPKSNLS